jgi:integrase
MGMYAAEAKLDMYAAETELPITAADNMVPSIIDLWSQYSLVLWEGGQYRDMAETFIFELHNILITKNVEIIDPRIVDEIISCLRQKGNRNSTINRKLAILYKLLRKAHAMGIITKVPVYLRLRENNARVRFLTPDEESFLFDAIRSRSEDHYRLCVFLVDSGARVGEALNIKWQDINAGSVTFWITKSGKSRTVPLTKRAMDALLEGRGSGKTGPFSMVDYQRFLYDWRSARKAVGLGNDQQVVPHILRHTCASRLVQAGIDLRRVQTYLGHQTIQMTLRYAHLATSDLDQCVLALERTASPSPC